MKNSSIEQSKCDPERNRLNNDKQSNYPQAFAARQCETHPSTDELCRKRHQIH